MSSDESTITGSDDEADEESYVYYDDEESEEGEEGHGQNEQRQYSDGGFESITGMGTKVLNRPVRYSLTNDQPKSRLSSRENLAEEFGEGEDEEEAFKELFVNTLVENGPSGLGCIDALQIAVVLEEMSDKLDIIGTSIDAPDIDLRSKPSVEDDLATNRPVLTIPATLDPNSNSLFNEKYILRQTYHTVAARRIKQMVKSKTPGKKLRRRLTLVLRDCGVSRFNEKGKIQSERTHMNIILDDVASELIQDFTFNSLVNSIEFENGKYEGMKLKVEKSVRDRTYITESKDVLKKLRVEKKRARKDLEDQMWAFEANRQELLKRKELEFLFVTDHAIMTKERMKRICAKAEANVKEVYEKMESKKEKYEYAHFLMLDVIYKRYREAQRRLEYWMEKYEVDKETLQAELDQMKADRARDLQRIAWLKAMIKDYEQIAMDDRRVKGIAKGRLDLEKLKNRKAVKIQAWWRGEMYRKHLGPYNPKKKEKEKKGKGK